MSTDLNGSGGANLDAGSDPENSSKTDKGTARDSVSFDTYQKVLDQKKKRDAELAEANKRLKDLEDAQKERELAALKEKEDFKKIAELRENELKEERTKRLTIETRVQQSQKMSAFLDAVSGDVKKQYWSLADLDAIVINPDTGEIDSESVKQVAKEFEATYPDVIQRKSAGTLPRDAAKGGGAKLTHEEWTKLPLDQKKARYSEVFS